MLSRDASVPLYEQLKDIIEHKIHTKEYKVNEQIPSERELGETYNVSRVTVRQAIALAEKEGLVSKVHGVGTFVAKPKIKQELDEITDFASTATQLGVNAKTKLIESNLMTSDFKLAKLLGTNVMDNLLNIQLIGYSGDLPIVVYKTYFPYELGRRVEEKVKEASADNIPFSTLDIYKQFADVNPTHVEQTFESVNASEDLSKYLKVSDKFPLLRVSSIIYEGNSPLEFKEAYYRGDKYRFFITRKISL